MSAILIIGATSAIAHAVARRYAADGHRLFLVARDPRRLDAVAEDLRVRGAHQVETRVMDALDYDRHESVLTEASRTLGGLDIALIAHGTLPDQSACEQSAERALEALEVNGNATVALLTRLANEFESRGKGTIAVISSVAGDRGRASNYVYATAKGAVNVFLEGLRSRLHGAGVRVVTIKPGFVDTPMTAEFRKGLLWASPDDVAKSICRAIEHGTEIAYVPWFWRWIMLVIRIIPPRLFKRLKL